MAPQVGMRWLRESWLIGWDVVTQVDGSEQIVVVHWLTSGLSMVGKWRLFGRSSGQVEVVAHWWRGVIALRLGILAHWLRSADSKALVDGLTCRAQ